MIVSNLVRFCEGLHMVNLRESELYMWGPSGILTNPFLQTAIDMTTADAIRSNAQLHIELVQKLESLQSAPDALEKQKKLIEELQGQAELAKQTIEKRREKTTEKKKKSSMVKKMASKVIGKEDKATTKLEREEREYVEALEAEMRERTRLTELENRLEEAKRAIPDLEAQVEKFSSVQKDLSSLYSRVFTLPTTLQEFPQLNEAHIQLQTARHTHASTQNEIKTNEEALKLLVEADDEIRVCILFIEEGLTQYGTWGGKNVMEEIGRELRSAKKAAMRAEQLVEEAREAEPLIRALSPLVIRGSTTGEDGSQISNHGLLAQINANKEDIIRARETVQSEIRSTGPRIEALKEELLDAEGFIRKAEQEVESARKVVWDGFMSGAIKPGNGNAVQVRSADLEVPAASLGRPALLPSYSSAIAV
ncbi:hypothetical protein VKT23_014259 [Stygiomarasmius scandens]|uniref:Uncharacterized protein n=1 Tax=Marasmiellus scandens TaxID=2682957 RepID=A0ABR1J4F7_9AGAR